jgi:hypothetical protein
MGRFRAQVCEVINRNVVVSLALEQDSLPAFPDSQAAHEAYRLGFHSLANLWASTI